MVFDAHDRAFALFKGACGSGIYDNMNGDDLLRQAKALQSPLSADVQPMPRRSGRLHAGIGLGEGSGIELGRARSRALLHATAASL